MFNKNVIQKNTTSAETIKIIENNYNVPLVLDANYDTDTCYLHMKNKGNSLGYYGVNVRKEPIFHDTTSIKKLLRVGDIPTIKFADYTVTNKTFDAIGDQVQIPLSSFGSSITGDKVICFLLLYWGGIKVIVDGDWGNGTHGANLGCALTALKTGTLTTATIRCVYLDKSPFATLSMSNSNKPTDFK